VLVKELRCHQPSVFLTETLKRIPACLYGIQRSYKHMEYLVPLGSAHRSANWPSVLSRLPDAALEISDAQLQSAQFVKPCSHDKRMTERWPLGIDQDQSPIVAFQASNMWSGGPYVSRAWFRQPG
jgi:hypothetical protein